MPAPPASRTSSLRIPWSPGENAVPRAWRIVDVATVTGAVFLASRGSPCSRRVGLPRPGLDPMSQFSGRRTLRAMRFLALAAILAILPVTAQGAPPPSDAFDALHWRMVGPFRGGRTRACAGVPGHPNVFYIAQVNGGVWKTDDCGRTWRPIFDDQPTQSIGSIAVAPSDPEHHLRRQRRGPAPPRPLGRRRRLQVDRRRQDVDAPRARRRAADPADRDRSAQPEPRVRGRARPSRTDRASERGVYPLARRRQDLGARALQGRQHRRFRSRDRSEASRRGLRGAVGGAARPVGGRQRVPGHGGGLYKSTDGGTTWKQLTSGLPANAVQVDIAIAPSRPSRLYVDAVDDRAEPLRQRQGQRAVPLRRRRRDVDSDHDRRAAADEDRRRRSDGARRRSDEPRRRLRREHRRDEVVATAARPGRGCAARPAATTTRTCGSTRPIRRRSCSSAIRARSSPSTAARPGAAGTTSRPRSSITSASPPTSRIACAAASRRAARCASRAAATTARSATATGTRSAIDRVRLRRAGSARPRHRLRRGRNEVTRYQWSTDQVQDITPIPVRGDLPRRAHAADRVLAGAAATSCTTRRTCCSRRRTAARRWQTISPDLGHPNPGVPPSVGALAAKDPSAEAARRDLRARAVVQDDAHAVGRHRRRQAVGHARRRRALERHHAAAVTPWSKVTQLDASHFDDTTVYASVSRLRVDDLAPYIYRTHDGGKTWTPIVTGLPPGPVNAVREDPIRKGLLYAGDRDRRVGVVRRRRPLAVAAAEPAAHARCATSSSTTAI